MITIKAISNIQYENYDEIWAIVRSLKHPNPHLKQVTELSPSWDLFKTFQELKQAGDWNQKTFQEIYVPRFLTQMKGTEARNRLNQLYLRDKAGESLALVCFCPDETLCHRSIIAGLLQGCGCNVQGVHGNYAHYFDQYKRLR